MRFFNNMFLIISLKKAINIWEIFFTESWGSNPVEGRLFSKIKSLTPTSLELQIAVKKFSQFLGLSLYQLSYRGKMKGGRRCSLGISIKIEKSYLFNYFVPFPVNFPSFSSFQSCFSTLISLENETFVTLLSTPFGREQKSVTQVSFSNSIRVEKQNFKREKGKFTGNVTK